MKSVDDSDIPRLDADISGPFLSPLEVDSCGLLDASGSTIEPNAKSRLELGEVLVASVSTELRFAMFEEASPSHVLPKS